MRKAGTTTRKTKLLKSLGNCALVDFCLGFSAVGSGRMNKCHYHRNQNGILNKVVPAKSF